MICINNKKILITFGINLRAIIFFLTKYMYIYIANIIFEQELYGNPQSQLLSSTIIKVSFKSGFFYKHTKMTIFASENFLYENKNYQ